MLNVLPTFGPKPTQIAALDCVQQPRYYIPEKFDITRGLITCLTHILLSLSGNLASYGSPGVVYPAPFEYTN